MARLTVVNHDRDVAGMTYVYPVVSRRARGVSVGVNLNPNNACNWRCIYCQVPGLVRGKAPDVDLDRLRAELTRMLEQIVHGDFMTEQVPEEARRLNDVALSGNGEPTSSPQFEAVIDLIGEVLDGFDLRGRIQVVLITNGSLMEQARVQRGVERMASINGVVWFKLDSATAEGLARTNSTPMEPARHLHRLRIAARRCPTFIQTCVFELDGAPMSEAERAAYLDAVERLVADAVPVKGVLLYNLARASHQPEASRLAPVSASWMEAFAADIEARGLPVQVSA